MPTQSQRRSAIRILSRAIGQIEAAQHTASVMACACGHLIDESAITAAKSELMRQLRRIEP